MHSSRSPGHSVGARLTVRQAEVLLLAVLERPDDATLAVYADFLEDHGDERGAHLRAQRTLRAHPGPSSLASCRATWPDDHPDWLARLEAAGIVQSRLLDVPWRWWGVRLPGRQSAGTYNRTDARPPSIRPGRLDGKFGFLRGEVEPHPGHTEATADWAVRLDGLVAQGWHVPSVLRAFLMEPALHRQIPSCTACFVMSAAEAFEQPLPDGGLFLTFYCDSQWCLLWGLRLPPAGDRYAPVLAGPPVWTDDQDAPHHRIEELSWCASNLEDFVYRSWIENRIWHAVSSKYARPLTDDEQAWLDAIRDGSNEHPMIGQ